MVTVHLVTNPRTMAYLDYIQTIAASGNVDAIRVKLADKEDNSDPARDHPAASRLLEQRYRPAKDILKKALLHKWGEAKTRLALCTLSLTVALGP